ncbi:MAG: LD-carboxypeptidase [Cyclobacteriaceae bacterium]
MCIKPPFLKTGDRIIILAPASKVKSEYIETAHKVFTDWGLKVEYGAHLFSENYKYAGLDNQRLLDLQMALDDNDIKAIICGRGGYGTTKIVDQLDIANFKHNPKWVLGFSDITALHSRIYNAGFQSLHGIMPSFFHHEGISKSLKSLHDALFGVDQTIPSAPHILNRHGKAAGNLVGGNLALLAHMVGTPTDIDTSDCILFLEDVGEPLYNIDRMMLQLRRSGKLKAIKGFICGQFSELKETPETYGKNANEIILEHLEGLSIPVCFDFPVGHVALNYTLPVGAKAALMVDSEGSTLTIK